MQSGPESSLFFYGKHLPQQAPQRGCDNPGTEHHRWRLPALKKSNGFLLPLRLLHAHVVVHVLIRRVASIYFPPKPRSSGLWKGVVNMSRKVEVATSPQVFSPFFRAVFHSAHNDVLDHCVHRSSHPLPRMRCVPAARPSIMRTSNAEVLPASFGPIPVEHGKEIIDDSLLCRTELL